MMKKVFKRIATMAVALALIVITGISMTACGSDNGSNKNNSSNSGNTTTNICNIDNLNGFYANIEEQKLYYFDIANNEYKHGLFEISEKYEIKDNQYQLQEGVYELSVYNILPQVGQAHYVTKLRNVDSSEYATVYKVWNDNGGPYSETCVISSYRHPEENKDLSKQFYAEDEKIIYTKISGLEEFLATVFPDKEIDTTDITNVSRHWEDLIKAL